MTPNESANHCKDEHLTRSMRSLGVTLDVVPEDTACGNKF